MNLFQGNSFALDESGGHCSIGMSPNRVSLIDIADVAFGVFAKIDLKKLIGSLQVVFEAVKCRASTCANDSAVQPTKSETCPSPTSTIRNWPSVLCTTSTE